MQPEEHRRMHAVEATHWWFRGTRRVILDVLRRRLDPGAGPIVDVGCGTGFTTTMLGRLGSSYGVDRSPQALALAGEQGAGRLCCADAGALPFGPGTVGVVTLLDVLEHVEDPVAVLREAGRILRPGGTLMVTVPAYQALWSEHDEALAHRERYRRGKLRAEVEAAGLELVWCSYYNTLLFPLAAGLRLIKRLARRKRTGPPRADLGTLPRPINALLDAVLGLERLLLRVIRLPFGLSVVAVVRCPREE